MVCERLDAVRGLVRLGEAARGDERREQPAQAAPRRRLVVDDQGAEGHRGGKLEEGRERERRIQQGHTPTGAEEGRRACLVIRFCI